MTFYKSVTFVLITLSTKPKKQPEWSPCMYLLVIYLSVVISQVFCALGEDVLCQSKLGNTLVHALARKGDEVSSVLECLLDLRYNDDGTRYSTSIPVHDLIIQSHARSKQIKQALILEQILCHFDLLINSFAVADSAPLPRTAECITQTT